MVQYKQCWYDIVIFDILISDALAIEIGLLCLKYLFKNEYRLYPEWSIAFKMLCRDCMCTPKWLVIIFNLLFVMTWIQIFSFVFCGDSVWIGIIRLFLLTIITNHFG